MPLSIVLLLVWQVPHMRRQLSRSRKTNRRTRTMWSRAASTFRLSRWTVSLQFGVSGEVVFTPI